MMGHRDISFNWIRSGLLSSLRDVLFGTVLRQKNERQTFLLLEKWLKPLCMMDASVIEYHDDLAFRVRLEYLFEKLPERSGITFFDFSMSDAPSFVIDGNGRFVPPLSALSAWGA
ncbi:hypothetical protein [Cohnella fermenti]|nr:hypothetical protein [Cohnella fermenti]